MSSIDDVKTLLKEFDADLAFEEEGRYIVIRTRRYLGTDTFAKIASLIREAGGEYVSMGKQSHFRVDREGTGAVSETKDLTRFRKRLEAVVQDMKRAGY